jgi:putative colanic acid biosynthesis acetyltransferase WcaF
MNTVKLQLFFFVLWFFNRLYSLMPSFLFRRMMLAASGSSLGRRTYIHAGVRFFGFGRISAGNNSTVNRGCYLDNRGNITIGSNVSIAHDCRIYTAGHDIDSSDFAVVIRDVSIGDYACIFAGAMIMPGVTVGRGAVVYPGSVVTKDVAPYTVVGGNPAKPLKKRSQDLRYTLEYGFHGAV